MLNKNTHSAVYAEQSNRSCTRVNTLKLAASVIALNLTIAALPAHGQTVGSKIIDPRDGSEKIVKEVFSGGVLTEDGLIIVTATMAGDMFPDPADPTKTVTVDMPIEDQNTMLPVRVKLTDGRTVDVIYPAPNAPTPTPG